MRDTGFDAVKPRKQGTPAAPVVVEDVAGRPSAILAGHPKLRNILRQPTMEEIGYPTDMFNLGDIVGSQRDYNHCLLATSAGTKVEMEATLTAGAIDILVTKPRPPRQGQFHLTLAHEAGYQTGEMPVTAQLVETVYRVSSTTWNPRWRVTATGLGND